MYLILFVYGVACTHRQTDIHTHHMNTHAYAHVRTHTHTSHTHMSHTHTHNTHIYIGVGTGGWVGYSPPNILLCIKELTVIKD